MIMIAGEYDISNLVGNVTWSGDRDQMARKLAFDYIHTDQDYNIKGPDIPLGTRIMMYDDLGALKFDGVVLSLEKEESDVKIKLSCQDMAFYLKSEVYNTYKGTPAEITGAVCAEFGIATGMLADNGLRRGRDGCPYPYGRTDPLRGGIRRTDGSGAYW